MRNGRREAKEIQMSKQTNKMNKNEEVKTIKQIPQNKNSSITMSFRQLYTAQSLGTGRAYIISCAAATTKTDRNNSITENWPLKTKINSTRGSSCGSM